MRIFERLFYHTWNIGFLENRISDIILCDKNLLHVNWVKHRYRDRFFADPFILDVNDQEINVLVEEFPYMKKKGVISLLTIDRSTLKLIRRKVVLKQSYHLSYPYVLWDDNHKVKFVAPEASQSSKLYYYDVNPETMQLENPRVLVDEPLLDSTIVEFNGSWWLFCTKRGDASNRDLYIYYSNTPEGPWYSHSANPVLKNESNARPAGAFVKIDESLYRVSQKCDNYYGEAVNVTRIDRLTTDDFHETFIKELRTVDEEYSSRLHTINGLDDIVVVDGTRLQFTPIRRIVYELCNKLIRYASSFRR